MEHNCCGAADRIYDDEGTWRYDDTEGYRGTEIFFCPFCGEKLIASKKKLNASN